MRTRILLLVGLAILGGLGGLAVFHSTPLIQNGALNRNFDGWETNAGISIFVNPVPKDWRYYRLQVRTGGIFHLDDLKNDHFAALGAGNVTGSALSQNLKLDGKGGRYGLSFRFAATGDPGTTGVVEISVADTNRGVLFREWITNNQPVKTYYVPRKQERVVKFAFDVPAGTAQVKLSFADQSPNSGIAVDPLIKNVALEKLK